VNTDEFRVWLEKALIKLEFLMALSDQSPGTLTALMCLWGEYDRDTQSIDESEAPQDVKDEQYRGIVERMLRDVQGLVMPGEISELL